MSKPFSFHDMTVVDQTEGSWDDAIGLIAYQYKKRRRGIIGEDVEDSSEPCNCEESIDDLTTTKDLEEAMSPQQKMDFQRLLYGAISRDEYNKKYKLGIYRPAGNKLAGPGGLYKNLIKKI